VKIFIAGGTGFVGNILSAALAGEGHEITVLIRPGADADAGTGGVRTVRGDPMTKGAWQEELAGHEAIINLVGASIFQPWTRKARREIYDSRMRSTENIVEALKTSKGGVMHLFNASGVGYYGFTKDAAVDEGCPPGNTFLAGVARSWEAAALGAEEAGVRVVLCRLGIVLGRRGGAFRKILPLVRSGVGGMWGSGEQWFPWVHEMDVARIVSFLLKREDIRGPVNFTSPGLARNREMLEIMNGLLGKEPFIRAIPEWMIRRLLGEFSTVFLEGQRAVPGILARNGFVFHFPTLREAVVDLMHP
jgi:uncharacterized protein (TIGR01777 family)